MIENIKNTTVHFVQKYIEILEQNGDPNESYKYLAISTFQQNWDISVENFHQMLRNSFSKVSNLLYQNSWGFIEKAARIFPEDVRNMFRNLYDESIAISGRIKTFQMESEQLLPKVKQELNRDTLNAQQDERTISVYLAFRFPEKYILYKSDYYKFFCKQLDIIPHKTGDCFLHLQKIANEIIEQGLLNNKSFIDIYRNFYSKPDWDDKHLMIQNVLYVVFRKEYYSYNNDMNYWTMQLHPNNLGWKKETELLSNEFLIGMGDWEEKASQQSQFENEMRIGDIVLVRRGSEIIALVEVTGDYEYTEDTGDLAWFERRRQIKILDWYKDSYGLSVSARKTLERCQTRDTATYSSILRWLEIIKQQNMLTKCIELLRSNKNIVLTGAPGTGKTYLAKQIAQQMIGAQADKELEESGQFSFVQFHPSYDYTDFVEGLRPTKPDVNGNIGFELRNGVFKEFCQKAIVVTAIDTGHIQNFTLDDYEKYLQTLKLKNITIKTYRNRIEQLLGKEINSKKEIIDKMVYSSLDEICDNFEDIKDFDIRYNFHNQFSASVSNLIRFRDNLLTKKYRANTLNPIFILVIDEINRGEISKIFGELFFSIDPGYRGEKGKVQTQYTNLIDDNDVFKNGFYVPENVYIIGTMNDIDRSVESMDFAMRRRFAWKEIKAIDRIEMWDGNIDAWKEDAKQRMLSLNETIDKINGLSSAYHIGPAYFLKLEDYKGDFEKLWENHLQGVLSEYLRGFPNIEEELSRLKNAYNLL